MKKIIAILFLITILFCTVVWAGWIVDGHLRVTGTSSLEDAVVITGDLDPNGSSLYDMGSSTAKWDDGFFERIFSPIWRFSSGSLGIKATMATGIGVDQLKIEATSGTNTDVRFLLQPKGTGESFIISSTSKIDFLDNELFSTGSAHFGTESSNFRLDIKAGGEPTSEVFTGSGLDDLSAGGTFNTTLVDDINYYVEIDGTGTPDTFKWSDDGGSTFDATDVNITGSAQTLNNGITVTFSATTGHTLTDNWAWTIAVHNPMWLQDATGAGIVYVSNDSKVGIKTLNPATVLDVNGLTTATGYKTSGASVLSLSPGVISDSSGAISFVNENLSGSGTLSFGSITGTTLISTGNINIRDPLAPSFDVILGVLGPITADRTVTLQPGDSDRTITLTGNTTLADWFDQSVKQAATPTFASVTTNNSTGVTLSGASGVLTMAGIGNTNNENLTFDFETVANQVAIGTGAGVSGILWDGISALYQDSRMVLFGSDLDYSMTYTAGRGDATDSLEIYDGTIAGALRWQMNNAGNFDYQSGNITTLGVLTSGGAVIGSSGNTTTIESDGTLTFVGNATVWDDIRTPLTSIRITGPGGTTPPDEVLFKGSVVLAFGGAGTDDEKAFFVIQIPHWYKEGTDIVPHLHWTPEDNTAGTVRWLMTHSWGNGESTFPAETTIELEVPADQVTDKHQLDNFPAISGAGKTISSMILCSIQREDSDANDTFNNKDAYLLEIDFHAEKDTAGSRGITTK